MRTSRTFPPSTTTVSAISLGRPISTPCCKAQPRFAVGQRARCKQLRRKDRAGRSGRRVLRDARRGREHAGAIVAVPALACRGRCCPPRQRRSPATRPAPSVAPGPAPPARRPAHTETAGRPAKAQGDARQSRCRQAARPRAVAIWSDAALVASGTACGRTGATNSARGLVPAGARRGPEPAPPLPPARSGGRSHRVRPSRRQMDRAADGRVAGKGNLGGGKEDADAGGMRRVHGAWTKIVSDRLNSRARVCIWPVVRSSAPRTMASGLPAKARSVKTSQVWKRQHCIPRNAVDER